MAHFITKQLPVIAPFQYYNRSEFNIFNPSLLEWIGRRVLELVYTSWDIDSLADWCIYHGPPFKWNPQRREALKAELDALFFHFYLGDNKKWAGASSILTKKFNSPRQAVEYILETFWVIKSRDEKEYGSYRTKELILEVYDKMAEAITNDTEYQTILDPPPGPPTDTEGNFIPMSHWDTSNWPSHIHPPKEEISE